MVEAMLDVGAAQSVLAAFAAAGAQFLVSVSALATVTAIIVYAAEQALRRRYQGLVYTPWRHRQIEGLTRYYLERQYEDRYPEAAFASAEARQQLSASSIQSLLFHALDLPTATLGLRSDQLCAQVIRRLDGCLEALDQLTSPKVRAEPPADAATAEAAIDQLQVALVQAANLRAYAISFASSLVICSIVFAALIAGGSPGVPWYLWTLPWAGLALVYSAIGALIAPVLLGPIERLARMG